MARSKPYPRAYRLVIRDTDADMTTAVRESNDLGALQAEALKCHDPDNGMEALLFKLNASGKVDGMIAF